MEMSIRGVQVKKAPLDMETGITALFPKRLKESKILRKLDEEVNSLSVEIRKEICSHSERILMDNLE